jgi:hypothetical protein
MNMIYISIVASIFTAGVTQGAFEPYENHAVSPDVEACGLKVGADQIVLSLDQIPKEVRVDLERRIEAQGSKIAEHGVPLLNTDAPTEAERGFAQVRFAQALRIDDRWFVQLEVAQFPGVRTFIYSRRQNGIFAYSPGHHFGGDACATIRAALAGMMSFPDI